MFGAAGTGRKPYRIRKVCLRSYHLTPFCLYNRESEVLLIIVITFVATLPPVNVNYVNRLSAVVGSFRTRSKLKTMLEHTDSGFFLCDFNVVHYKIKIQIRTIKRYQK